MKTKRSRTLLFETLERREMLDASHVIATLVGDHLTVFGTSLADTIDVRQIGDQLYVNHATRKDGTVLSFGSTSFNHSDVNRLSILGNAEADSIRVAALDSFDEKIILVDGGSGDDTLEVIGLEATLLGGPGDDRLAGRDGRITSDHSDSPSSVEANLLTRIIDDDGHGSSDRLRNIQNLRGSDNDDVLIGSRQRNTIYANGGNDFVSTIAGENIVAGGDGDDTVVGGDGVDAILGGLGSDTITGGGGDDIIDGGDGSDTIWGGSGDDLAIGNKGNDVVYGGTGNDLLRGEVGQDTLDGEQGDDFIDGGVGDDNLLGDAGADVIKGGDGDDSLFGHAGSDLLIGGKGSRCDRRN